MAIPVTEATFDRDVVELSRETPVVVDFWAEWCGPCRTLTPALEAAEASRGGRVLLAKVDVDSNQALAARHGVQGIPAVKAFRDGEIVDEPTLEVKVDNAVLPKPAWGVPVATDPGKHVIEASAQWKVPVRLEVDVPASANKVIEIPALLTTAQAYAKAYVKPDSPQSRPDYVNVEDAPIERPNVWYKVANTTMIIGFVAASITGAVWLEATIERRSSCVEDRNYCSTGGLDAADRERTWGTLSIVGLALGVGGLVTAAILPKYKVVQPTAQGMMLRF